jgi:hypothetical protein
MIGPPVPPESPGQLETNPRWAKELVQSARMVRYARCLPPLVGESIWRKKRGGQNNGYRDQAKLSQLPTGGELRLHRARWAKVRRAV